MIKIASIVGARPQFIKVAPILRAIDRYNENHPQRTINEILIHTGQHYDYGMSDVFFHELEIPKPDYNLGIGSGSHGEQTGEMLKRTEAVLVKEEPDIVMVYGDTNSTLAGALAAAKLHIPVAHVEAGLRSFNRRMPEEINRVLTDHVSDLFFCPTETAVRNLEHEGFTNIINDGRLISGLDSDLTPTVNHELRTPNHEPIVLNVGDVMYDSVLYNLQLAERKSTILDRLHLNPHEPHELNQPNKPNELHEPNRPSGYALATVHRAENTDNPERLRSIFQALQEIAESGLPVILPLHPRTRNKLQELRDLKYIASMNSINPMNSTSPTNSMNPTNLVIIGPLSYLDMLVLEKNARVILTDSGGVQKEAFFFRVPCVTLREETEWVETVETGWNTLVGCDSERVIHAGLEVKAGSTAASPYGDGHAAERIVEMLRQKLS